MQHQERPNNSLTMQAVIQAMLFDVIGLLSKEPEAESEENGKDAHGRMLFEHFLQLITSNEIKRRPVDYYSEQLHVTSKYLTTLCTKYSGKSASAWIHQYTKEDIRHYLLHTSLSIKEIAYKMGFPSLSFFGSYVRHYFGMSPSKLRAK